MAESAHQLNDDESVYDKSGTDLSSPKPDLKALEGGGETTELKRGHLSEANDKKPSRDDLSEAESNVPAPKPSYEKQVGLGYRSGANEVSLRSRLMGRKKLLWGGGVVALIISLMIAIFGAFWSTLKLPHLESHLGNRLTRSARTFTERVNALNTDKVLADPNDPEVKNLLSDSLLGKALNAYNPKLAVRSMQANGHLDFEYDANGKITTVVVDGERIAAPDIKFGSIIKNRQAWKSFYQDLYSATDRALLRDGQSYLVRTRVSKAVIQAFGGKLYFWQRKGADEAGKSSEQVLEDTQKIEFTDVQEPAGEVAANGAITDDLNKTARQALEDEQNCLSNPDCAKQARVTTLADASGANKRVGDYANSLKSTTDLAHTSASVLYVIGAPLCMIYDGSIKTSKAIIDAQQSDALRAYLTIASAADQQKKGDVTAEAVGGLNNLVGDISNTNPEKLARGESVDTSIEPYAQAAKAQNYTIFNSTFGPLAGTANDIANWLCPQLLSPYLFGILAGTQIISLLTGPYKEFSEKAASEGVKVAVQNAMKQIYDNVFARIFENSLQGRILRNGALKFGIFNGGSVLVTDALTDAARMEVESEMGSMINGGDLKDLVNQADMGAVVYNSELDRQQNFGRPMSANETNQTKAVDKQFISLQDSQKGVFQKYLAISNPNSVVSNELVRLSGVISKPSKIAASIINFPAALMSSIKPLFATMFGHALAATSTDNQDYNVVQWGWTNDENSLIDSDSSFDPLVNAQILQSSGQSQAILDKYGVCFGVKDDGSGNPIPDPSATMGKLLSGNGNESNRMIYLDGNTGSIVPDQGLCSPNNLSYNNNEFGPKMIFRWRLNQSYQSAMNELTDMQNATSGAAQ